MIKLKKKSNVEGSYLTTNNNNLIESRMKKKSKHNSQQIKC